MTIKKFFPIYQPDLSGKELEYVTDCVTSGWISSLGEYVQKFEEQFAEFCGVEHAVAMSNGTVSLHLALILRDIGPGDEVIVPDLTFVATANAVRYTGATPVFVDSDPEFWTMDPESLAASITPRTRAIIPVHLYGHPADMGAIMDLAAQYDLFVIEDAAEAHGAEYQGVKVGALGHIGSFSFYGNKVITTGEGGMLTSNDSELIERARFLKDHGMSKDVRYWHSDVGYNYRITNIQAAIGLAQLERIESILERKIEIARLYHQLLEGCPGIVRQGEASWAKNVYWMYSVLVNEDAPWTRDALMDALHQRGVDSRPFFVPMHELPPYKEEAGAIDYPVASSLAQRGLNLPSYPALTDGDINYICKTICDLMMVRG